MSVVLCAGCLGKVRAGDKPSRERRLHQRGPVSVNPSLRHPLASTFTHKFNSHQSVGFNADSILYSTESLILYFNHCYSNIQIPVFNVRTANADCCGPCIHSYRAIAATPTHTHRVNHLHHHHSTTTTQQQRVNSQVSHLQPTILPWTFVDVVVVVVGARVA